MLRQTSDLQRTPLQAVDGEIGRCKDFLFHDETWIVRYMVADTGKWIPERKVLISPISIDDLEGEADHLPVSLTRRQIEEAPLLDEDAPVSRRHERELHGHFGLAFYWRGSAAWGMAPTPRPLREGPSAITSDDDDLDGDPHLRSVGEVRGYAVTATDGQIGHVDDFLVDDETWVIRYLIANTGNWLASRKVLLSPDWIAGCDWAARTATAQLTKQQIETSPEFRPEAPVDRAYEARLHDFYGRSAYWDVRGV